MPERDPGAEGSIDAAAAEARTFLIADISGYTAFTEHRGDEAAAALAARFADIAEEAIADYRGELLELRGDEVLGSFTSARQGLRASVALQARYRQEGGPEGLQGIPVRVGLDCGDAIPVRQGYRGGALNLAARLCALAGAGEVLASEGVIHLARKTEGLAFVDRGEALLKGLSDPVHVFQVCPENEIPERIDVFTLEALPPTNLPAQAAPFIGRVSEVDELIGVMADSDVSIVTLTGPGGSGKTRLAQEIGARLRHDFKDGVFLVSLAGVGDPSLVAATIAGTLGVPERDRPVLDTLRDYLLDKSMLLILDNFERLVTAAADIASIVSVCPTLKLLVTSQVALRLSAEQLFPVPPLHVADPADLPPLEDLAKLDSVAFFVERAGSLNPRFVLNSENARAIAEICYRLDGLPLALELAAARTRLFTPQALVSRLGNRLALLTGGARDAPSRQQALRAAIDWSYELLGAGEKASLAQLAVFSGGWDLEAAEEICAAEGVDVLLDLQSLVEKSLVHPSAMGSERQAGESESEPRFMLLETIREYALERLAESGVRPQTQHRYAEYFLRFAEAAEPGVRGSDQLQWIARLKRDHDNLRAALDLFIDSGEAEKANRMVKALWRFWWMSGYLSEGRDWIEGVLAMSGDVDAALRAAVMAGNGVLAWSQNEVDRAEELHRAALQLREEVGDRRGVASSLNSLATVYDFRGDYDNAVRYVEAALDVMRDVRDDWLLAVTLGNLGAYLGSAGRYEEARQKNEESLAMWERLGDRASEARVLNNLAEINLNLGDYARAAEYQSQALKLCLGTRNEENLAFCLEAAAKILGAGGAPLDASRLWGAAERLRASLGQGLPEGEAPIRKRYIAEARSARGDEAFQDAWREGAGLTAADAGQFAIDLLARVPQHAHPQTA